MLEKSGRDWQKDDDIKILDWDGWDDKSPDELISYDEYVEHRTKCTIDPTWFLYKKNC